MVVFIGKVDRCTPKKKKIEREKLNLLFFSYRYGLQEHQHLWTAKAFKKSCRGVSFTPDGSSKSL